MSNSGRRGSPRPNFPELEGDLTLLSYVSMDITGGGRGVDSYHYEGSINWVGSQEDSITYVENLHLVLYAELVAEDIIEDQLFQAFEPHLEVCSDEFQLRNDVIGFEENIIPILGLDTPNYEFSLTCSTET